MGKNPEDDLPFDLDKLEDLPSEPELEELARQRFVDLLWELLWNDNNEEK